MSLPLPLMCPPPLAARDYTSWLPPPVPLSVPVPASVLSGVGAPGHRLERPLSENDAQDVRRSKAAPSPADGATDDPRREDGEAGSALMAVSASSLRCAQTVLWTAADDELIEQLRQVHGNAWKTIAAALPAR